MSTQRPAFSRENTDIALHELEPQRSSSSQPQAEFVVPKANDGKNARESAKVEDVPSESPPPYEGERTRFGEAIVIEDAKDLVTTVIHVEDDESLNPWTFRMFFLGIGLSIFGSVLQEIFYFKPQTIYVSNVFLAVIAYVLGEFMSVAIPQKGVVGRFLNPGSFNLKEHAAVCIMASAAAQSALSTQALAAQQLFYGGYPNRVAGVFITLSTQLLGYGICGLLRHVLVYPTKMLWPMNLPVISLLESLHRDKAETKQQLKLFYIIFIGIFLWEIIPEWIFPVLQGVSVFCLANQNSLVFTNLFGGTSGNEGLGFLSLCLDWQYIASLGSPLWLPLYTLTNNMIGYLGCIVLFMGVYYSNTWRSQDFPFLSQLLFNTTSTSDAYVTYNTSAILNAHNEIDTGALQEAGLPWMTGTYLCYLITSNMGLTATIVHMLLWNYDDIKAGWAWVSMDTVKKMWKPKTWEAFLGKGETVEERMRRTEADPALDPHYRLMLKYPDSPPWWWASILVFSFVVGMVCLYVMNSTLPWWGFIISILTTTVFTLFFGAQYGITGFQFNVQPFSQMLAGYILPGKPIGNMYFTCYTYNALQQAQVLAKDLKLAQYVHLPPRATFIAQLTGCIIGALFNFIIMLTTVEAQADVLRSIEGNNIWSGQNIQQFNSLAISWSIAGDMFSIGGRYQWVTISFLIGFFVPFPFWIANKYYPHPFWSYINMAIILWYLGWLFVGINASIGSFFILGIGAQFWLRRYRPEYFVKYNYLVSAALDGGTQVLVFILTFAVFGGSGNAHDFPVWAGNNGGTGGKNLDYCMMNPANGD